MYFLTEEKIKIKNLKFLIISILLIIISSHAVIAVGISPAKMVIDFKPGLEINKTMYLINSGKESGSVIPSISGKLSEYILLPDEIEIKKNDYKIPFLIQIKLPGSLNQDEYKSFVKLKGTLKQKRGTIVATTAVKAIIDLRVPVSEKSLEADLFMRETNQNTIDFTIGLTNVGSEDIDLIKPLIRLFDGKKETMSFQTNPIGLSSQHQNKLKIMNKNIPTGNYIVDVDVTYDGKTLKLKDDLVIESGVNAVLIKKPSEEIPSEIDSLTLVLLFFVLILVVAFLLFFIVKKPKIKLKHKNKLF